MTKKEKIYLLVFCLVSIMFSTHSLNAAQEGCDEIVMIAKGLLSKYAQ